MSDATDEDMAVWEMALDMITAAPPKMPIEWKIRAVALHLAMVSFSVSQFDQAETDALIDAVSKSAKRAARTYSKSFKEIASHTFPEPNAKQ